MQHRNKTLIISGILLAALGLVVFQIISGQGTTGQAAGPEPSIDSGVTWGPSYYTDDSLVEPGLSRDELDFMRQVDRQALTGKTWGPSYSGEDTIVAPGTNLNKRPAITSGPSYYANDTIVASERHQPELEWMKQIDQNALRGVSEGPSYHP